MSELQQILSKYLSKGNASPSYRVGIPGATVAAVSPIVGLNGYTGSNPVSDQSTKPQQNQVPGVFGQTKLQAAPSAVIQPVGIFGGGRGGFDSNSGTSFSNTGGSTSTGLGNVVSGLGMLARITKDPTLGQAAGLAGAGYGALNGNYTSLGGLLGGLVSSSPYGSLAGALAGNYFSPDTSTSKFAANAALGLAVPGYGILNSLSGGWIGNSLFGTDAQKNALGQTTIAAVPGIFGNLGWNNNNANTTQQDFRAAEIAAQNAAAKAEAASRGMNGGGNYGRDSGFGGGGYGSQGSGPEGGGTGSSHFG